MADNKIVIGGFKEDKSKEEKVLKREKPVHEPDTIIDDGHSPVQETYDPRLDENIWGSDFELDKKLKEEYLLEKRRYVRIRYIQSIACKTMSSSLEAEPVTLFPPLMLTTCDLSVGGIGIISDTEISEGTILDLNLTLDEISYNIKCAVVYCIQNKDKYRIGLKIALKDKAFIKHLKIYVARISLQSKYG